MHIQSILWANLVPSAKINDRKDQAISGLIYLLMEHSVIKNNTITVV